MENIKQIDEINNDIESVKPNHHALKRAKAKYYHDVLASDVKHMNWKKIKRNWNRIPYNYIQTKV